PLERAVGERQHDVALGPEMLIERAHADTGRLADIGHGHPLEAKLHVALQGRIQDVVAARGHVFVTAFRHLFLCLQALQRPPPRTTWTLDGKIKRAYPFFIRKVAMWIYRPDK